MENYFLSTQKNRPVLFSTPMVVPCLPTTPRCDVYDCIWNQVLRLIIPDPPNTERYIYYMNNVLYLLLCIFLVKKLLRKVIHSNSEWLAEMACSVVTALGIGGY